MSEENILEDDASEMIGESIQEQQELDTIRKLDKDVALIKQKLDILENNHLAHIKKDVDRILYILGAVGIVVLGELFVFLNDVL